MGFTPTCIITDSSCTVNCLYQSGISINNIKLNAKNIHATITNEQDSPVETYVPGCDSGAEGTTNGITDTAPKDLRDEDGAVGEWNVEYTEA